MNLRLSIIKTLGFFGLFRQPLTLLEIQKFLWSEQPADLGSLTENLKTLSQIKEADGFFFLLSQGNPVEHRLARDFWQRKKLIIAKSAARLLASLPFIKLVAICNSLGFGTAEEKSDIDFFIIARQGRIWLARFLCNLILRLFNLRTYGIKMTNKICLSFFINDSNLNLEPMSLTGEDPYLVYWITQLTPLINREGSLEKFWQANSWIKKYIADFQENGLALNKNMMQFDKIASFKYLFWEKVLAGRIGDYLEKFLGRWQIKKISQRVKTRNLSPAVIINDQMIKLHQEDRREEYRKKWLNLSLI